MTNPESRSAAHEHNRRAWDSMVRGGDRFTKPARDEDFADPLKTVDGPGWLGREIRDKQLLCLAAGGGKHSALYAAAGAIVTVVDISPAMLELDRNVAVERGLHVRTVEASMDAMPMFESGEFDIVIHPVSTCYVPDVLKVYREVARITHAGGLYISQHKQPTSLQSDVKPSARGYEIIEPYYRRGPLPNVRGSRLREDGTLEYLHRWEELIGGLCRNGFVIEDLIEPFHADKDANKGSFGDRCRYIPPYVRIKSRRVGKHSQAKSSRRLWTP